MRERVIGHVSRRRKTRPRVVESFPELRRGLYVPVGTVAWRRVGCQVPHHLRQNKVGRRTYRRAFIQAVNTIGALLTGPVLWNRAGPESGPDIAMVSTESNIVLFDLGSGQVQRRSKQPTFDALYQHRRSLLAEYLDSPKYEITDEGRTLVEEFVPGRGVSVSSVSEQHAVVSDLWRKLAGLVATTGAGTAEVQLSELLDEVDFASLSLEITSVLDVDRIKSTAQTWPVVVSHGDLNMQNILVQDSPEGPRFVLLDWAPDHLAIRPFWYDALSVLFTAPQLTTPARQQLGGRSRR